MRTLLELVSTAVWLALWGAGGWLLAARIFRLRRAEVAVTGLAIGLVLEVWLANLLARGLPLVAATWASAFVVLAAGIAATAPRWRLLRVESSWRQWLMLAMLTFLFTAIGRGLAIFDDYQNLPTISLMATGDIPPHFALNPSLNFGYHYFLLLFSAQVMRLADLFPWTALDIGRGLMLALPLMLAGLWGRRLARSVLVGWLTAGMVAFAGGARWLLLFLPQGLLAAVSGHITLIGSASTSAGSYAEAVLTNWKIDGAGPLQFPFAFYTGINQPYIMLHTGIAGSGILILLVLLLVSRRERHWTAHIVAAVLVAALALANEIAFLLLTFGTAIVVAWWAVQQRSLRLPRDMSNWGLALLAGGLVAAVQGGLLTEMIRSRLAPHAGDASYFDTSVALAWPPAIVSAHLGSLSLFDPAQLLAALGEIGPVILVTPLLLAWMVKAFRVGRWYEAALISAGGAALIAPFLEFKGPLFSAWPRLLGGWLFGCALYSAPLLWLWARRRSAATQVAGVALGLTACLSGLVLFAMQLPAMQRPVLATFITPLDARMSREYWNRLEPGALVFDPVVYRAPTVFGRFTLSSPSWYAHDPAWDALAEAPSPQSLRHAGFTYAYLNKDYWDKLPPATQALFGSACVKQVAEVEGIHSEQDYSKDFRRLLDISACQ